MNVFRYNCSFPFLLNVKKLMTSRGLQITQEGLIFDQTDNKYIDIETEDDIFSMIGLKSIPPKYRIGGFISPMWFTQDEISKKGSDQQDGETSDTDIIQ